MGAAERTVVGQFESWVKREPPLVLPIPKPCWALVNPAAGRIIGGRCPEQQGSGDKEGKP
jgi:hypothetical protein